MTLTPDVVVVGSGPNGLAAAVTCARAGLETVVLEAQTTVGGGARTLPFLHGTERDVCSAAHPLAALSPFFTEFELHRRIDITVPQASYAHPLDGGRAAIAWRDLERTAAELGRDQSTWKSLFSQLAAQPHLLGTLTLGDKRSLPPGLLSVPGLHTSARLGRAAVIAGTRALQHSVHTPEARALLTGVAAHAMARLPDLAAGGTAAVLGAAAHSVGWPIVTGGSQAITDALIADLEAHGGRVLADTPVRSAQDLPPARAQLFDTSAAEAVRILGAAVQRRVRTDIARFPHGAGVAKVDFVLSGPVPWAAPEVAHAGTVHLGGSAEELVANSRAVNVGRLPARPTVLLSDPAVADRGREVGGLRPLWTYAQVPFDCAVDVTAQVVAQIERFAPGFRELIVASQCVPANRMSGHDANLGGGNISAGEVNTWRLLARPRPALNPYALGSPGAYLCSAATPPGPGVHGMCGWWAAKRALRERFSIREMPSLGLTQVASGQVSSPTPIAETGSA